MYLPIKKLDYVVQPRLGTLKTLVFYLQYVAVGLTSAATERTGHNGSEFKYLSVEVLFILLRPRKCLRCSTSDFFSFEISNSSQRLVLANSTIAAASTATIASVIYYVPQMFILSLRISSPSKKMKLIRLL